MTDIPSDGVTLEWIGRALIGLQGDIREVKGRLDRIEGRLDRVEHRLDGLERRVDEIQQEQLRQSSELTTLRLDTSHIRERLDRVGEAWKRA